MQKLSETHESIVPEVFLEARSGSLSPDINQEIQIGSRFSCLVASHNNVERLSNRANALLVAANCYPRDPL
jgi:hypothetical protein